MDINLKPDYKMGLEPVFKNYKEKLQHSDNVY